MADELSLQEFAELIESVPPLTEIRMSPEAAAFMRAKWAKRDGKGHLKYQRYGAAFRRALDRELWPASAEYRKQCLRGALAATEQYANPEAEAALAAMRPTRKGSSDA